MAWCRQAPSHCLSRCWHRSMPLITHDCPHYLFSSARPLMHSFHTKTIFFDYMAIIMKKNYGINKHAQYRDCRDPLSLCNCEINPTLSSILYVLMIYMYIFIVHSTRILIWTVAWGGRVCECFNSARWSSAKTKCRHIYAALPGPSITYERSLVYHFAYVHVAEIALKTRNVSLGRGDWPKIYDSFKAYDVTIRWRWFRLSRVPSIYFSSTLFMIALLEQKAEASPRENMC